MLFSCQKLFYVMFTDFLYESDIKKNNEYLFTLLDLFRLVTVHDLVTFSFYTFHLYAWQRISGEIYGLFALMMPNFRYLIPHLYGIVLLRVKLRKIFPVLPLFLWYLIVPPTKLRPCTTLKFQETSQIILSVAH
ncbi:hypothetical protein EDEG_00109 [Edhazardia aedis USNM 41457]|uniref:Uncharacterized protein n=1 Tax=Edhazardia aedis (strain USNM 41457) TaxID=1003232 RepID=J9DBM0_EDHAE|nr:hypothetical protein EDEG_00109 [Edhazardia aedis USNM 41457]|eukprot:EJW04889.1 hypothetical protein EDEG_00109 [Edhazardia aedis USNM 41457]